jgi:hypothetical protein
MLNEPWKEDEEDGFDIYVDSLHNLPDNCSIVKVIVRIINNKGALQIKERELWPRLDVSSF